MSEANEGAGGAGAGQGDRDDPPTGQPPPPEGFWDRLFAGVVSRPAAVVVVAALLAGAGLHFAPFDVMETLGLGGGFPRDPIPVDAIPNIGENQQIVFTDWPGRSPRDVEDQISYPLTTALLGTAGVEAVRGTSMFGFSSLYVIFEDGLDPSWARGKLLEKLASLPDDTLPEGVAPTLGPDATALGQIFWYTLEGRDPDGRTVGGWDLFELRTIQDWTVRQALQGVRGVAEVASVGGHVRELLVEVDPDALEDAGVTLDQIGRAVAGANRDVGARTLEINAVEYVVRGVGLVRNLDDVRAAVVALRGEDTPIRVGDVASVGWGPAPRRGVLDDAGAEVVGGVVVARTGANPGAVLDAVKAEIARIASGLPSRTLDDGTTSRVTIVPFYDRTTLIDATIATLGDALSQQVLFTAIVILVLLGRLGASFLVTLLLPLGVLATFVTMRLAGVEANLMALAGIAIAIGTMVDMGIVLVENVVASLDGAPPDADRAAVVRRAVAEVAPAVATSTLTTVASFLPVFGLEAAEGKLFGPLAATKSFAVVWAWVVAAFILPVLALGLVGRGGDRLPATVRRVLDAARRPARAAAVALAVVGLAVWWRPLGGGAGALAQVLFVAVAAVVVLGGFALFQRAYPRILAAVLDHRAAFFVAPSLVVVAGALVWLGVGGLTSALPPAVRASAPVRALEAAFPGLGREYMPSFDEGDFLLMPTTMPHASLGTAKDLLATMDAAIAAVPEVDRVVGKLGRVDSALDPAPVSMFETLITYRPEWGTDADGNRVRNWRDHVRTPDDVWDEIVAAADLPGLTAAPKLYPIETRLVMLQSGVRAPTAIRVEAADLDTAESLGLAIEDALAGAPSVRPGSVQADRAAGKPYLEVRWDRDALARSGVAVADAQATLEAAVGGRVVTRTIDGRARFPVRVRYARALRQDPDAIRRLAIPTPRGAPVPLDTVADILYVRGPQSIRSEGGRPVSYVIFEPAEGLAESEAVEGARAHLAAAVDAGQLEVPPGASWAFTGRYESRMRSEARLRLLVPLTAALVFVLLYLQFRRVSTVLFVFAGVLVASAGGMLLLRLVAEPWFLDTAWAGLDLRALFDLGEVNLSVAVWVGFIALLGIATDDGVVMATYLDQRFREAPTRTVPEIRARVLEAGRRRLRPCLMTTATTLLALLPVLTSTGKGADVMRPMALPIVGGMTLELLTLFVVPALWAWREERALRRAG